MKTHKSDRRSERTQRLLGEALVKLLEEKKYGEITIQDLLDQADIGRSTFYAQYYDKDDLLSSRMEQIIAQLCQRIGTDPASPSVPLPTLGFLQHIYEHRNSRWLPSMIHGQYGDLLTQGLHTALGAQLEQYLHSKDALPSDEVAKQSILHLIVGGFLSLVRWWVDTDFKARPERINAAFQQAIMPLLPDFSKEVPNDIREDTP
jgi:AcrR family transcriptional regulator